MVAALSTPASHVIPLEEERAVLIRVREGDPAAFATLYGWYATPVFHMILSGQPDRARAEDILKEAFRRAMEQLHTFELMDRSIYFWIKRIAMNLLLDDRRREVRHQKALDHQRHRFPTPAGFSAPDRGLEIEETARDVDLSLSRLPPRYADALRMRLIEGRPREECALALDVTVETFDVLLHRAAKAFRKVYPP